jgi:protein-S-isoprenylcysteine O-methyltransferase Ste14
LSLSFGQRSLPCTGFRHRVEVVVLIPVELLIEAAWAAFLLYWAWSARHVKVTRRSEPLLPRLFKYWLPLMVAVLLIVPIRLYDGSLLHLRLLPAVKWLAVLGMAITWAGVLFACRARSVLGTNWSSEVQLKQDHELIVRGPYRLVRHPIYTGLLLAFFGSALALGELRGLLALAIVAVSFWIKLRLEERWMREQFGSAYTDYMQRVKALVPGVL